MNGPSGVEFPGGVVVAPATQEDIDYVERNYRDGERRERALAGADGVRTLLEDHESCWTVRAGNGDVLGYLGLLCMPGESCMSRMRGVSYMSCHNVDRHAFSFVKSSAYVMKWLFSQAPRWVDTFRAWPAASFERSVVWQKKVLGMREVGRVPVGDDWLVVLETTRSEVERLVPVRKEKRA